MGHRIGSTNPEPRCCCQEGQKTERCAAQPTQSNYPQRAGGFATSGPSKESERDPSSGFAPQPPSPHRRRENFRGAAQRPRLCSLLQDFWLEKKNSLDILECEASMGRAQARGMGASLSARHGSRRGPAPFVRELAPVGPEIAEAQGPRGNMELNQRAGNGGKGAEFGNVVENTGN